MRRRIPARCWGECRLRSYLTRAVEAFYHELDMVTLADLIRGNCGLAGLLATANHLRASCQEPATTEPA